MVVVAVAAVAVGAAVVEMAVMVAFVVVHFGINSFIRVQEEFCDEHKESEWCVG